VSANYYVKDGAYYVVRRGRSPKRGVFSQENQPASLSRPEALRLLADWLEAGYNGRLVRAVFAGPSRAQLVVALSNVIGAYGRANVYRVDQETGEGVGTIERLNDDARVAEANDLIARLPVRS